MFDYINDLIPVGRFNRPGNKMSPEFITVHDTGNESAGANALMHARYLKTTDREVSWHYTVDDTNVIQHLPYNEIGWHAGTSQGNNNSIGVEICMNSDGNRTKAEENAQLLCVDLMKETGIALDHIVQHNHWSGKNCPQVLRARENGWEDFINGIDKIIHPEIAPAEEVKIMEPELTLEELTFDEALRIVKDKVDVDVEYWKQAEEYEKYIDLLFIKFAKAIR